MNKLTYFLVVFGTICIITTSAAQESTKLYMRIAMLEMWSIGADFLGGEIGETFNTGIGVNILEVGITPSLKHPGWIIGFTWAEAGLWHQFNPTPAEEVILSNYEIITTTHNFTTGTVTSITPGADSTTGGGATAITTSGTITVAGGTLAGARTFGLIK